MAEQELGGVTWKQRTGLKQTWEMVGEDGTHASVAREGIHGTKNCCMPGSMLCSFSENALPTLKFTCEGSAFTWSKRPGTQSSSLLSFHGSHGKKAVQKVERSL